MRQSTAPVDPSTKAIPARFKDDSDYHRHGQSRHQAVGTSDSLNKIALGIEEGLRKQEIAIIGGSTHFETLGTYDFDGTSFTPNNIQEFLGSEDVYYHLWAAAKVTVDECPKGQFDERHLTREAFELFLVDLACAVIGRVNAPHFTFVDPRFYNDASAMVRNAFRLSKLFFERGVHVDDLIISIPATEMGISAAKELGTHGLHTNLYLVCDQLHAAACAEADASAVTIDVGLLLDWYERKRKAVRSQDLANHPGIESIQSLVAYFKQHELNTKIIGTAFRNLSEIGPLGSLDAICLTKTQVDELKWSKVPVLPIAEASPAFQQAQKAEYPTTYLNSKVGPISSLPIATREKYFGTMFTGLGRLKTSMETIESLVKYEVTRNYQLKTGDLGVLYGMKSPKPTAEEEKRGRSTLPVKQNPRTKPIRVESMKCGLSSSVENRSFGKEVPLEDQVF